MSTVAFLSEVAYDADFFDHDAYSFMLEELAKYNGLTGVVLDGVMTRLDRPEFLADGLVRWAGTSVDEAIAVMKKQSSTNHTAEMLAQQFHILGYRLGELKKKLPNAEIVLVFRDDNLQFSISKIINERVLAMAQELDKEISNKSQLIKQKKAVCRDAKGELTKLEGKKYVRRQRDNAKQRIKRNGATIDQLRGEVQELRIERAYFRESKTRPLHQAITADFMDELTKTISNICKENGVKLVTTDKTLNFGDLSFHYAHSGHETWGVLKTRDKRLRDGVQFGFDKYGDVDAVVESGHHGRPMTTMVKRQNTADEMNFKFGGEICEDYLRVLSVMPFESRDKLSVYAKGGQYVRLSGGKALASRNSMAVKRYHNNAPTGLTLLHKTEDGRTGVQWVEFKAFSEKRGIQPLGNIVAVSADEHIGGPFWNPLVTQGWVAYLQDLAENLTFFGQVSHLRGVIKAGDEVDSNTDHWKFARQKPSFNPVEVLKLAQKMEREDLVAFATQVAQGGTVESMDCTLDWGTDYLEELLNIVLEKSHLKVLMVRVPGNHSGSALARLGMDSNCYFIQRLKVRQIPFERAGSTKRHAMARVMLGGFGIYLGAVVDDYGLDWNGEFLFGPLTLYVAHNPKGRGLDGLSKAGMQAGADVVMAGHTHEFYVVPYLLGEKTCYAVRVPTLEGVTDVEVYFGGGILRVQGALLVAMPTSGQFAEEFVFVHQLT